MLSRNGAASDGVDADLSLLPRTDAVPAVNLRKVAAFLDGPGQHFGGAAGGVDLLVVVLFDDLNVKPIFQNGGNGAQNFLQDVDAQGGVLGAHHRCIGRKLPAHGLLSRRKAGGGQYAGHFLLPAVRKDHLQIGRVGKINDHMGFFRQLGKRGQAFLIQRVDDAAQFPALMGLDGRGNALAHGSIAHQSDFLLFHLF